jgi:hypothetical protein
MAWAPVELAAMNGAQTVTAEAMPLNDATVSGSGGAAASRLDVVAVGVDDEGGIIVRREVARSWSAIVFRAGRERRIVKRPNGGPVWARQSEMHAGSRFAGFADPQARRIAPKSRPAVKGHELLDSERSEGLLINAVMTSTCWVRSMIWSNMGWVLSASGCE